MLTLQMPSRRSARNVLRESLWFDGFRPWGSDTYIRPAWPERWALDRARAYLAKGSGLCVHGTLLGAVDLERVRKMLTSTGSIRRRVVWPERSQRSALAPAQRHVPSLPGWRWAASSHG
jgi:hypothetical protein